MCVRARAFAFAPLCARVCDVCDQDSFDLDSLGSHKNMFEFVKEVRSGRGPGGLRRCNCAASAAERMCVRAVGLVCLFLGASCPAQWARSVCANGRWP